MLELVKTTSNQILTYIFYTYLIIRLVAVRSNNRDQIVRKRKFYRKDTPSRSSRTQFTKVAECRQSSQTQLNIVAHVAFSVGLSTTDNQEYAAPPASVRWDTDSIPIRVDNCCTRSISFDIADFDPNTLQEAPEHLVVSGLVSETNTPITKIGTIVWRIVNDDGNPQNITIPNSYLIPGAPALGTGIARSQPRTSRYIMYHHRRFYRTTVEPITVPKNNSP
jgi:hypothetical protein